MNDKGGKYIDVRRVIDRWLTSKQGWIVDKLTTLAQDPDYFIKIMKLAVELAPKQIQGGEGGLVLQVTVQQADRITDQCIDVLPENNSEQEPIGVITNSSKQGQTVAPSDTPQDSTPQDNVQDTEPQEVV